MRKKIYELFGRVKSHFVVFLDWLLPYSENKY